LGGFVYTTMAIATVSCLGGIIIPMMWDIPVPSGGAILIVAAAFFIVTTILRNVLPGFREARI
ncbi:MAG: metal ABC transporter permease, partial [Gammaproteobacteria bacterium]